MSSAPYDNDYPVQQPAQPSTDEKGIPKRRGKRRLKGFAELVDENFAATTVIVQSGKKRRVTNFEAIFSQLVIQEAAGDRKAGAVRTRYQEYATQLAGPRQTVLHQIPAERPNEPGPLPDPFAPMENP